MDEAKTVAQSLDEAARGVLARSPLNDRERRAGCALRVAGCVRAGLSASDGKPTGFVWSVFVLARGQAPVAPRLGLASGIAARRLGGSPEARLCGGGELEVFGEAWNVAEYEIEIPRQLLAFVLTAGKARRAISREQRNRMANEHFSLIRNAYADAQGYASWLTRHRDAMACAIQAPPDGPLISLVVPVFKTPEAYLEELLESVESQTYGRWELVIANASPGDEGVASVLARHKDPRVRAFDLPENRGITENTNEALKRAAGDYVAFLDHDDFLEPYALAAIANEVRAHPDTDLLYCDEDTYDGEVYRIPLFKPPLNWSLLYSNNYIIHLLTVSRRVLEATERSGTDVDGAQDYDLTFKALEQGGRSAHIPWVLYHWRMHAGSTNANAQAKPWAQEAARRAIAQHLERRGIAASVAREKTDSTYRVSFEPPQPGLTLAHVVIKGGGAGEVLAALRGSLGKADVALLRREDVLVDEDATKTMLTWFARPEVFSVSPRVMRGDGLVESSGCLAVSDGSIVKIGKNLLWEDEAFLGRAVRPYDHLVVTDDACMVRLSALEGWLDEAAGFDSLRYGLNALCVRAYESGMANVYCPFATARVEGPRTLAAQWNEVNDGDCAAFAGRYADVLANGDPTHNPNFDPRSPYYRLNYGEGGGRSVE